MNKIIVRQNLNCNLNKLWQAITQKEQMKQWFFNEIIAFEPVEGFSTSFDVSFDGKTYTHLWTLLEVVPEEKIVYDWRYKGVPGHAKVTFEIEKTNNNSKITLTHEVIEPFNSDDPAFTLESTKNGWKYFIQEALPEYLNNDTNH